MCTALYPKACNTDVEPGIVQSTYWVLYYKKHISQTVLGSLDSDGTFASQKGARLFKTVHSQPMCSASEYLLFLLSFGNVSYESIFIPSFPRVEMSKICEHVLKDTQIQQLVILQKRVARNIAKCTDYTEDFKWCQQRQNALLFPLSCCCLFVMMHLLSLQCL